MDNESIKFGLGWSFETKTVKLSEFTQPFWEVEVAMYVIDELGVEIGLLDVGLFKKVLGCHWIAPFVFADKITLCPRQILVSGETVKLFGSTIKVTCFESVPHESEIVTVNVVVELIVAIGFGRVGLLSTFAGDQLYFEPPNASN